MKARVILDEAEGEEDAVFTYKITREEEDSENITIECLELKQQLFVTRKMLPDFYRAINDVAAD